MTLVIDFEAHGEPGEVRVDFGPNTDPAGLGFDLLGLDLPTDLVSGFPFVQASTSYPGRGYRALFGWLQVVRYTAPEDGEFLVDAAPQFRGLGIDFPFVTWGHCPTLFDAPAIGQRNVDWWADAFLVVSPDLLMTPTIEPLCCFRWGYTVDADGTITGRPPRIRDTAQAWAEIRDGVRNLHPGWTLR